MIKTIKYYETYHGHKIEHLKLLINEFRNNNKNIIFLVGDSSLDNKHWILNDKSQTKKYKAINGYENILNPPYMIGDVCFNINTYLKNTNFVCINCAVEESSLLERSDNLLDQDNLVKENITDKDILLVSVGGNDIILKPNAEIILNFGLLYYTNSIDTIKNNPLYANGFNYFKNKFHVNMKKYILELISIRRPIKVIMAGLYFPDENDKDSKKGWADNALKLLGYNTNPKKLQAVIKSIYEKSLFNIKLPVIITDKDCKKEVELIPFPMYDVMNGKTSHDYIYRVEPSMFGGCKIANKLYNILTNNNLI